MSKIRIHGTGCCLLDFIYPGIDFGSREFRSLSSKKRGDGGLSPGKLVFMSDLERFSGLSGPEIIDRLTGHGSYETVNIGGPSIVSLIHAAQLLRNDAKVKYYGMLGKDDAENMIRDILRELPLVTQFYGSGQPTPATHVLSDPNYAGGRGERTFINTLGAALDMKPEMLGKEFYEADICAFGGTALVPELHDHLDDLLYQAKKAGALTVVNTVFDFRNEQKAPDKPWPLLRNPGAYPLIDILLMDQEEACRISGSESLKGMIKFFHDSGLGSFIITNGPQPAFYYSSGTLFRYKKAGTLPVSAILSREFMKQDNGYSDTTGCGDNFVGGVLASLAWQLARGKSEKPCLEHAVAWGMVSGGFAGLYMGGRYKEKEPGEKLKKLLPYFKAYQEQTGLEFDDPTK